MPRNYKKKGNVNSYTQEQFEAAKEAIKKNSIRKVSRDLNIPFSTLRDWHNNPNIVLGSGNTTVLSVKDEDCLVSALEFTAKCGFPPGRDDIKNMVQSYVKHTGIKTPFKDGRPGRDWIVLFEKRHKQRLRRRKPDP